MGATDDIRKCRRCNGTGYLDCFSHVQNGRCFACGGRGEINYTERKAHDAKLAVAHQIPQENEITDALKAAGLRTLHAGDLAAAWHRVQVAAVWDEPVLAEIVERAAAAERVLSGDAEFTAELIAALDAIDAARHAEQVARRAARQAAKAGA